MEDYFTLEMAYNILLKEYQISSLQEIPYDTYQRLSITIGNLKTKEYGIIEKKIVQKIIENLSIISNLLLQTRIEKILIGNINSNLEMGYSKMTDEEKFIIDGEIQSKRPQTRVRAGVLRRVQRANEPAERRHIEPTHLAETVD